jgi:hypothetical protein
MSMAAGEMAGLSPGLSGSSSCITCAHPFHLLQHASADVRAEYGLDGPDRVARLNHYAIGDYALPAPGRMLCDEPPAAGPDWFYGP